MKKHILIMLSIVCAGILMVGCANEDNNTNAPSWAEEKIPSDYKLNNDFWDNASVYFVLTDRFYNGDASNDTSYERSKGDPTKKSEAGMFYGGDIAGLTQKLNYLDTLGINAIWITAPYEQIHGWCVGGSDNSKFIHYPYHGYYALDYTNVDANIGTVEEFRSFVDTAHKKGIRVIMDVVMNHPGYNTIEDARHLYSKVLRQTDLSGVTLSNYHSYIDYTKDQHGWDDWWGGQWIRAGLCSHYTTGSGDLEGSCGGSLPDFITESSTQVKIPTFLKTKYTDAMKEFYPSEGYSVVNLEDKDGYTVRDYLIYWLSSWVREFGIDGFRCDTAKHVEKEAWYQLKVACVQALRDWKKANPDKAIADSGDFWMTGEHFNHIVSKDEYFTNGGFNSMINFAFRASAGSALNDVKTIESVYADYASKINEDNDFNVLSYISSHDTGSQDQKGLFYSNYAGNKEKQNLAGSYLSFCPGAIQVYYGDECGRKNSSASGDQDQKNRSQMPWDEDGYNSLNYTFDADIHAHWSKVLNFRKHHVAVGAGTHAKIADSPYTFSRVKGDDKVIVVLGASGSTEIDVSSVFSDGTELHDAYSNTTATVTNGRVTFAADSNGTILIEKKAN